MDKIFKEDVRHLINDNKGPCVSLYMPTSRKAGNDVNKMKIRVKNLIKKAKKELENYWDFSKKEIEEFLHPLEKLSSDRSFWLNQSLGLAVFLSHDKFEYYRLPLEFTEKIIVSENYYIKQIIPELFEDRKFYVLTLSRNMNRFFRCTREDIRQIELDDLPESIEETLKYDDPEKSIQYHSNSGNGSAIYHGQGVTDEDNKEDLMRYLRQIDSAVYDYLHESDAPLVLMCVDELFPLYNKANSYSNILEEFVQGNPDKINPHEILNNAWDVVKPNIENYKKKAVNKYQELRGSEITENSIDKIVRTAYYGKIDSLLIEADKEKIGFYKADEDRINFGDKEGYFDLYNFAAIHTIMNSGEVYILNSEEMPSGLEIAAVYRY